MLRPAGLLVVAVPAADDLAELREAVLGEARDRDRAEARIGEHAGAFALVERSRTAERRRFDRGGIADLLAATYRAGRAPRERRAGELAELDVTLAHDLLAFRRA